MLRRICEQLIVELTEKAKSYDGEIESSTEALMQFVNEVKSWSKIA